jgi:hypothetical protein
MRVKTAQQSHDNSSNLFALEQLMLSGRYPMKSREQHISTSISGLSQ